MSIEIHGVQAVEKMRRAGQAAAATLARIGERLRPGISTKQIDLWVREHTKAQGGRPSQLGYHGFPASVCTSRNEVVCHGIPNEREILVDGDILNVDVTTELDGYHGDTSATFLIGEVSRERMELVEIARRCRDAGISVVRDGARLGDIGAAIVELAKAHGYSVVQEYCGHGIGRSMHAAPQVSHVGVRGSGPRLRAGMAITVEPMINMGTRHVRLLPDEWTVVTEDGRPSAQFEHTIVVTRAGAEIMTNLATQQRETHSPEPSSR